LRPSPRSSRCRLRLLSRSCSPLFRCANYGTRDGANHGASDWGTEGTPGHGTSDCATQGAPGRAFRCVSDVLTFIFVVHVSLPKLWDMTLSPHEAKCQELSHKGLSHRGACFDYVPMMGKRLNDDCTRGIPTPRVTFTMPGPKELALTEGPRAALQT
jgi:hypothetical protein